MALRGTTHLGGKRSALSLAAGIAKTALPIASGCYGPFPSAPTKEMLPLGRRLGTVLHRLPRAALAPYAAL